MPSIIGRDRINPRHLREKYKAWEGQRVVVGLSTWHYLCGTWERTDDNNNVVFQIGEHEMKVPIVQVMTVSAANPVQADFFK